MTNERERHDKSEYVNGRTAADMQNERARQGANPTDGESPAAREKARPANIRQRIGQLLRRLSGRDRTTGAPATVSVLLAVLLLAFAACDPASDGPTAEQETATEAVTATDDGGTVDLSRLAGSYAASVSDVRNAIELGDGEVRVDGDQIVVEHDGGSSEYPIRDETEISCDDSGCTWETLVGEPLVVSIPTDADGPPFGIVSAENGGPPHTGGFCGEGPIDERRTPKAEDAWTTGEVGSDQFTYTGMLAGGGNTCITYTVELTREQ